MNALLLCVDPAKDPDEYDSALQLSAFATAALASPELQDRWQRVALIASPAAALEILLAALDVTDRATVEGGERRRSPLVLLPPIAARHDNPTAEEILRAGSEAEAWSGTLADLERAGVFERDTDADSRTGFPASAPPSFPPLAQDLIRTELDRRNPTTVIVLGGRPEVWETLGSRRGIIAFGRDARERRPALDPNMILLDDVVPPDGDTRASPSEDATGTDEATRHAIDAGAMLGARIAALLEHLYRPDDIHHATPVRQPG